MSENEYYRVLNRCNYLTLKGSERTPEETKERVELEQQIQDYHNKK